MIVNLIALLVLVLITTLYYVSQWKYDYWRKRKIPYLKPVPFLGNYGHYITLKKFIGEVAQELCQKFPNVPYFGAFFGTEPTLVVQDPEFIKIVMTKDFYYFSGREISKYTHREVFSQNLAFTYGDRWRVLRQNLTPLFSSSKMKNMFYLIEKCSHVFEDMLDLEIKVDNVQEVRSMVARFTMDCIGTCAFGVDTKTMDKDSEKNPFTIMGHILFEESYIRGILIAIKSIWPSIFFGVGLRSFPKKLDTFFNELLTKVFSGRGYEPTNRNDFVDLILNWKKEKYITGDSIHNMKTGFKKVSLEVDDEILIAHCMAFFGAGFETSSLALQYSLYELAKNSKAQDRVIEEVDAYLQRHNNKLGYECVTELPYTEACFDETLRLYPVAGVLTREVFEDYTLPCGAVLEKGVRVHIPVYHLHHNPDFFPDPEVFKPERFLGEEKRNVIPYSYLPFGEGPRLCIGMRFARMQMYSGLITIMKKYRVELAAGTPQKLEITSTSLSTMPKKPLKLKFVLREGWPQRQLR